VLPAATKGDVGHFGHTKIVLMAVSDWQVWLLISVV